MKKYYLLFLFLGLLSNAQIVNIPDANFKETLLNHYPPIDTNYDNEIQVSEALSVSELTLSLYTTIDLTGIESFTNVTNLDINSSNYLTNIDLTNLINLQNLNCSFNHNLTSINLSNLSNLTSINVNYNDDLNQINFNGTTNLTTFVCTNTGISSFDFSQNSSLQTIDCSNNNSLNTLILTNLTNLQNLNCSDNYFLTNLDLSNLTSLQTVNCSSSGLTSITTTGANSITHLNCSNNFLTSLNVTGMSNLQVLNCSYNKQFNNIGLTSLDLTGLTNLTQLNCGTNSISTLEVSQLTNLTSLYCERNLITSLTVAPLINLTNLNCAVNQISILDVSTLTSLQTLIFYQNLLTIIDLSNLINLNYLDTSNNPLNSLDVTNLTQLMSLSCSGNNLTSLNLNNQTELQSLYCENNLLTTIDLSNCPLLRSIGLGGNLFTSIDLSNLTASNDSTVSYALFLGDSPNLEYVNFKNELVNLNDLILIMHVYECPNLSYFCTDESNIATIQEIMQIQNQSTANVGSYCTFIPGGIHNTISGIATLDINNNGCDASDYQPDDLKITINDGTTSGATFSNNGDYAFYTQAGSFTLTPQFENPYFTVSPATVTLNFPTLDGSTQTQNFCITPNGVHNDVDVVLLPITPARPGFDATYQLTYKNKGNQTLSGTVNFSFDDAILDFITANPAVDSQVVNVLSWNYSNLLPFESRTIHFTLNVNAPTETPPVNIDDVLNLAVMIEPIVNDETPEDNVFNLNQIVVGSYDPNDKTCLEGDAILPEKVGDYLHYLIRFQNSGTAPAENVVVKDMIDTNKFDLASFQLTATSHPQVTRITGNKVEFIFENIQLPAEQDNEPASHGYIAFKIRTKNNLVLGNSVSNTADIYFDYNFPIITNTATTTIVALGVDEFENASVVMTPNPVKDHLSISADDVITSIQMYDVQGRLITTQLNNSNTFNLDMNQQSLGIYFVKVITEKGVKVEKIIKE